MQQHVYTLSAVCAQFGIEHAVICPGSRSAPLVYAFLKQKSIHCYSITDERSAAFVALGMAQQLQKPVVLICTSGTAALNFFPAIAEAFYQKIPLLVLTADRPPELLNQQDGQMIMQKNVYGTHVLASYELPCFSSNDKGMFEETEEITLKALLQCYSPQGFGPVHINVPLREPLYDEADNKEIPKLQFSNRENNSPLGLPSPLFETFQDAWKQARKKMILIGQLFPSQELSEVLQKISNREDVVLISDVVSNQHENCSIACYDPILQYAAKEEVKNLEPDLILSFGGPLVSKALKTWLKLQKPKWHFRVQQEEKVIDTYQNVTHALHADPLYVLKELSVRQVVEHEKERPYFQLWQKQNENLNLRLKQFHQKNIWCEPSVMARLLNLMPENSVLHLGNSSTVRWVSWNLIPHKGLSIYCNRGTSGIDGTVSTALGAARINSHQIHTLILGDLSLLYDQNAFWQNNLPANLKIIVLNNRGGNIFNWIEGPSKQSEYLDYFTTPQNLSIKKLADQYGLRYLHCHELDQLNKEIEKLYQVSASPNILELEFDTSINLTAIKDFRINL